ncbi:MAG: hypothetical protein KC505_05335 [Myxococcales bacterium]|nr:hypothetical protein [Myxococcales bacterium]USN51509.1 MAG: hypothetical protein H6731_03640 [Myxococcales bacterium]
MGFWFFLTTIVLSNMIYKSFKLRMSKQSSVSDSDIRRLEKLESEIKLMREQMEKEKLAQRLTQLEDVVFFDDYELKRKFSKLDQEMQKEVR